MISVLKWIAVTAIIGGAISLSIISLVRHTLMPTPAELSQIDAAVQSAAPSASVVRRLRAPDRVELIGDKEKVGYFTYEVSKASRAPERYRADWRITDGKVELVAFKHL